MIAGRHSGADVQKIAEKPLDVADELTADIAGAVEQWVVAGVLVAPNHEPVQPGAWKHYAVVGLPGVAED